ncbi:MAG TPA: hypothetical protein VGT78_14550 [Rhizomicrobium sp.]|nr:hypothetical protein [Rhizomicrobium sp.]
MMAIGRIIAAAAFALAAILPVRAQEVAPTPYLYVIRYDHWTDADERGFGEFITAIGQSDCRTVNDCLHGPGNPFRASDPAWIYYHFDCADLPYALRAYYAWKRGLPFSYESAVEPRGRTRDVRYTASGNAVTERRDVLSETISGFGLMEVLRDTISSATYRIHPDLDGPLPPDFYSPSIDPKSIRPGTLIYDPNGHVGTVFRVDPDGRINFIDAHPDNSLTRGFYDQRFVRARPDMGAGFKNWRPMRLVGASRRADGALMGGHVVLAPNAAIPDFSDEQYFGNGQRPPDDGWSSGAFKLYGETLDYYDYVRARLAGGKLQFDPLKEVGDLVASNCADLQYRADAVNLAIAAGMQLRSEPARLPFNIYGADGDWETYSTPSRDARLKTAFRELRDEAERFVRMYQTNDPKLVYSGNDLVGDLLAVYDRNAAACKLSYTRSDGSQIALSYEAARRRLFLMSFDPYQCVERRWGATDRQELATCTDDADKRGWYAAEQNLRNQIDRDYEAEMDFTRAELAVPGPGKGVAAPPDTDVRAYLLSMRGARPIRESARAN